MHKFIATLITVEFWQFLADFTPILAAPRRLAAPALRAPVLPDADSPPDCGATFVGRLVVLAAPCAVSAEPARDNPGSSFSG
jgi:hypothetical protein